MTKSGNGNDETPPTTPPSGDAPTDPAASPGYGKIIEFRQKPRGESPGGDPYDRLSLRGEVVADRFILQVSIATGGMGCVYIAHDHRANRDCVLKVSLNPLLAPRFEREAHCLWLLEGTRGVPTIYDHGMLPDGRYFIAMQLIKGITLSEQIALLAESGAKLEWRDVVDLGIKINSVLSAIHRAGIIHRDVKPSNIMITQDEEVFIVDYGMAWFPAAKRLTGPNVMFGTEGFQSPEQRTGQVFDLDQRSDIYSVAMTMRFALGGAVVVPGMRDDGGSSPIVLRLPDGSPFTDKYIQAVMIQRNVRALLPLIPGGLADTLQKASSLLPRDRFSTADEFSAALRPFASEPSAVEPVAAGTASHAASSASSTTPAATASTAPPAESTSPSTAPPPAERASSERWWRVKRMLVVGASTILGAALVVVAFSFRSTEPTRPIEPPPTITEPPHTGACIPSESPGSAVVVESPRPQPQPQPRQLSQVHHRKVHPEYERRDGMKEY